MPPSTHLLLLVPFYEMGGANKFDLDLIDQLTARDWHVTTLATLPSPHAWIDAYRAKTPHVHRLDQLEGADAKLNFFSNLAGADPPDAILIAQAEIGYLLLPYLREILPRAALADYVHLEEAWGNGGFAGYAAGLSPLLDATLSSSKTLADSIQKRGGIADKLHVCPVNVDTQFWQPDAERRAKARAQWGTAPDEIVIAFSGRLTPQKQPALLLESLDLLAKGGTAFRALIAGDGPERGPLEAGIERARLGSRVHLLGVLAPEGVRDLLAAADLFFLPSANEGIALSIYEAMAMGLPILGADVGGQRELVTPDCGTLLPGADAAAYAKELARLIADPELRRSQGQAGRARVEQCFALAAMGEKVAAILEAAIERRAGETGPESQPAALAREALRFAGQTSSHTAREWLDFALAVAEIEPPGTAYRAFALTHARRLLEGTPTFALYEKLHPWHGDAGDEGPLRAFRASLLARLTGRGR